MAIHELAANAIEYCALSEQTGEVRLTWLVSTHWPPDLLLRWPESGGPAVTPSSQKWVASRLIERSPAQDLNGKVRIDYVATELVCTVEAPLVS
jgi:two-component sensor histidine kinase